MKSKEPSSYLYVQAWKHNLSELRDKVRQWKRYDDDKFAFFKPQTEHKIQFALNSYNKNIRIFNIFNIFFIMFEYELEQENRVLLFLTFKIQKSVSKGTLTHISTKNERWKTDAPLTIIILFFKLEQIWF